MSKPRILITGSQPFATRLAMTMEAWFGDVYAVEVIEAHRANAPLLFGRLLLADALYLVGGGGPGVVNRLQELVMLAARLNHRLRCVQIWIGSDVATVVECGRLPKSMVGRRFIKMFEHVAVAPWLASELETCGISAVTCHLPVWSTTIPEEVPPFTGPFAVLTYLPEQYAEFYGQSHIRRLSAEFPDVDVYVVGAHQPSTPLPRARYLGWIDDMASVYSRTHVLIRMTEHDGMPNMVQEALGFGRHVLWTYELPGVTQCDDYYGLRNAVGGLRDRYLAGCLPPNLIGRQSVLSIDPRQSVEQLLALAFSG